MTTSKFAKICVMTYLSSALKSIKSICITRVIQSKSGRAQKHNDDSKASNDADIRTTHTGIESLSIDL